MDREQGWARSLAGTPCIALFQFRQQLPGAGLLLAILLTRGITRPFRMTGQLVERRAEGGRDWVSFRAEGEMRRGEFGMVADLNNFLGIELPSPLASNLIMVSIGNIVTWEFVGYNMLIFFSALKAVPQELYEAAEIDGAGTFRTIWSIKLPQIRGAILIATLFSIIGSFQLFNEPSIMQSIAPNAITSYFTPNMYAFNLSFAGSQFNYAAAIAIISGVITMVVAYAAQAVGNRK